MFMLAGLSVLSGVVLGWVAYSELRYFDTRHTIYAGLGAVTLVALGAMLWGYASGHPEFETILRGSADRGPGWHCVETAQTATGDICVKEVPPSAPDRSEGRR